MERPSQQELIAKAGIGQSYASMILNGKRTPPRPLAIRIFRRTGWKHDVIADLTDEQIELLEQVEPYAPPNRDA